MFVVTDGGIAESHNTEFALIVEDADVPLPSPILHGLYYGIPSNIRSLSHQDLLAIKNDQSPGMKYGLNLRKTLYSRC